MRGVSNGTPPDGAACAAQVKEQLKALMGSVHSAVTVACHEYFERFRRHVYVTPRSYLAFLSGFRELYSRKLGATRELASSINSGLAKLNEAKVDVNRMKARAHGMHMHALQPCWTIGQTLAKGSPTVSTTSPQLHECRQMCIQQCATTATATACRENWQSKTRILQLQHAALRRC